MNYFNIQFFQKNTTGDWYGIECKKNLGIKGFSYDTRLLANGEMFVALKTENRDGHDYLEDAKSKGALAALVERVNEAIDLPQLLVKDTLKAFQQIAYAHRKRFAGKVVGVTGSCGKTTAKDWLTCLLNKDATHATQINLNNLLGVPFTLTGIDLDRDKHAVIEAGMNMLGEMEVLSPMIEADLAIITNVFPVHLEMVGTIDDIAWQKSLLGQAVLAEGRVLFPISCLKYEPFRHLAERAFILVNQGETLEHLTIEQAYYYKVVQEKGSIRMQIQMGTESLEFQFPLMSDGMLANAALVIVAARLLGVSQSDIKARMLMWKPAEHRGEEFSYKDQYYFLDCYNANPIAMRDALVIFHKLMDSCKDKDRLYILGCMGELGEQSGIFHYEVGKNLKLRNGDRVIAIGKDAHYYAKGLIEGGNHEDQVICFNSKEEAKAHIEAFSGNIFIKGSKLYCLWELLPKEAKRIERPMSL